MSTVNNHLPPLRIVATYYDDYHQRQHFKGFDNQRRYCFVEIERGVLQLHSFAEEPECPIREDIEIIEVNNQGQVIRQVQSVEVRQ